MVLIAKGREIPANKTRNARSPISFSPISLRLAKPLCTVANMRISINIATCKKSGLNNQITEEFAFNETKNCFS